MWLRPGRGVRRGEHRLADLPPAPKAARSWAGCRRDGPGYLEHRDERVPPPRGVSLSFPRFRTLQTHPRRSAWGTGKAPSGGLAHRLSGMERSLHEGAMMLPIPPPRTDPLEGTGATAANAASGEPWSRGRAVAAPLWLSAVLVVVRMVSGEGDSALGGHDALVSLHLVLVDAPGRRSNCRMPRWRSIFSSPRRLKAWCPAAVRRMPRGVRVLACCGGVYAQPGTSSTPV